jgi:RNA polymerase sigma-70 factor, ECF subfamily
LYSTPPPLESTSATDASVGTRLVRDWQAGRGDREEIFRQIFDAYYRPVYGFFAHRHFPPDQCQDLAQETFLKVYRGLPEFRGDSRFETWLFQIAANLWRNTLRSQSTQKREGQEVPLEAETDPEPGAGGPGLGGPTVDILAGLLSAEESELLRSALAELPPQMRRCVELRIQQDLRYREIAVAMQVSIDTVKAHLYQARQQLKTKLAGYFADSDLSPGG